MAQQLQEMLGKAFKQKNYALGMTGSLFQAYEVKGYMDANGNYVESSFVKCFRDGGLMLFDEIDGSNPQALVALNASLENEQSDFPCGIVKRHKNFRIIACANTFGKGADREYVGGVNWMVLRLTDSSQQSVLTTMKNLRERLHRIQTSRRSCRSYAKQPTTYV